MVTVTRDASTHDKARSLAMVGRRGQRASMDPEYEARIELAVKDLTNGTYKTIHAAAKAHKVSEFQGPRSPSRAS